MASEFHPMCVCAIYWISEFREVLLLGPEALITKPERAPPSCQCVQVHLVPMGYPENPVICQYTRKPAVSSCKQQYVRRLEGSGNLSLLLALQEHCVSICQPLGAVGPEQPVSS